MTAAAATGSSTAVADDTINAGSGDETVHTGPQRYGYLVAPQRPPGKAAQESTPLSSSTTSLRVHHQPDAGHILDYACWGDGPGSAFERLNFNGTVRCIAGIQTILLNTHNPVFTSLMTQTSATSQRRRRSSLPCRRPTDADTAFRQSLIVWVRTTTALLSA